jgi:integrin alpha FG-GAP repeat containing protein 1
MTVTNAQFLVSMPLSSILPTSGDPQLLLHVPGGPSTPLPIRLGDYNVDGFPDLLLTIHNSTAAPGGGVLAGSRKAGTQVKVLENVPCSKGVAGCEGKKDGRGLKVGSGSGWEALDEIWDASGASWFDVDDDVSISSRNRARADK